MAQNEMRAMRGMPQSVRLSAGLGVAGEKLERDSITGVKSVDFEATYVKGKYAPAMFLGFHFNFKL
jgi:hypothetical protein